MLAWLALACLNPIAPSGSSCSGCHGSEASAAPPAALGGSTRTEDIGVGAHAAHLEGATLGVKIACGECHQVPDKIDAEGHVDSEWPAEVKWGELTKTGGITDATWDRTAQSCGNTYCHSQGGAHPDPVWTVVDQSQLGCDSCHGDPPAEPHPQSTSCGECHPFSSDTHIDGTVTLAQEQEPCTGCHGTEDSLAPPPDSTGATDTTLRSVGAHTVHTEGGELSAGFACSTCHLVPSSVGADGHLDGGNAEVSFGGIATGGTYDDSALTCTVYCHSDAAPTWTVVDGSQAACGSCHGVPPGGSHPQSSNCSGCHSPAGPGQTIDEPEAHCNGVVEL